MTACGVFKVFIWCILKLYFKITHSEIGISSEFARPSISGVVKKSNEVVRDFKMYIALTELWPWSLK